MSRYYEAEVIIGIEPIAIRELQKAIGQHSENIHQIRPGFIRFHSDTSIKQLNNLKSIVAVYSIHHFDIPRPKALLGHEHFTRLTSILSEQIHQWGLLHTITFGVGVAGSDSSVIRRLKSEVATALDINAAADGKGELFWRLIRSQKSQGWEVLVRVTPKPLATRAWRYHNIPGALNATVAFAMTQLIDHPQNMRILNLCSGTGTIAIEYASYNLNSTCITIDNDISMLHFAAEHSRRSSNTSRIQQLNSEAQQTPLEDSSIDAIFADLPFGHHIGSHDINEWLYPAILEESARIAKQAATFILITHEIQLLEESVKYSPWGIKSQLKINLNGLHPRIFVLELK